MDKLCFLLLSSIITVKSHGFHGSLSGELKEIDIGGEKFKYTVSAEGYWHLDPCSVIGHENHGLLGILRDLKSNENVRRLNPYYGVNSQPWPKGIVPYYIHRSSFDSDPNNNWDQSVWDSAIAEYNSKTSIRIRKRVSSDKHYINVTNGEGCWSVIGRSHLEGPQTLSLGYRCQRLSTVVHELFHALGSFHTHQRSDRDDHVTINFGNIKSDSRSNFEKKTNLATCSCFNCGSVMMYGKGFFSSNGQDTITPRSSACVLKRNEASPLASTDVDCLRAMYDGVAPTCSPGSSPVSSPTPRPPTAPAPTPRPPTPGPPTRPAPTPPPVSSNTENFCMQGTYSESFFNGYYVKQSGLVNGGPYWKGAIRTLCPQTRYVYRSKYNARTWYISPTSGSSSHYLKCLNSDSPFDCTWLSPTTNAPVAKGLTRGTCDVVCPKGLEVSANYAGNPCVHNDYAYVSPNVYRSASGNRYLVWHQAFSRWMCHSDLSHLTQCNTYRYLNGGRSKEQERVGIIPNKQVTIQWGGEAGSQLVYLKCNV